MNLGLFTPRTLAIMIRDLEDLGTWAPEAGELYFEDPEADRAYAEILDAGAANMGAEEFLSLVRSPELEEA